MQRLNRSKNQVRRNQRHPLQKIKKQDAGRRNDERICVHAIPTSLVGDWEAARNGGVHAVPDGREQRDCQGTQRIVKSSKGFSASVQIAIVTPKSGNAKTIEQAATRTYF